MSGRPPRDRWYLGGLLLCIVLGLAATAYGVFSPSLRKLYARNIDSVEIATCAEGATSADIAGWWTGVWIQPTSPYYRPLSSMLFWLEYKAFGMNFQGHVLVSWVLHAVLCALLYRLAFRLLPGPPRERVCFAVVAVVLFNLRRGPTGPDWIAAPVAHGVVAWWPGQTDQFCLLCCLPALSLLDRWWLEGGRRDLAWGGVLTAVALLFKEMAVTMPLLAGCLGLYRGGPATMRLWEVREGRRHLSVGPMWKLVVPGMVAMGLFLLARHSMAPEAWGPEMRSVGRIVSKVVWYAAELPSAIVMARGFWVVGVSLFLAAGLYVYARLPRRPSAVWLVLGLLVGAGVVAQLLEGNFAILTVPREMAAIGTMTLFILGVAALLHVRRGLTWPLLALVAAVHLPILHVQGPHYLYWPAAFWGLFNASLLQFVWDAKTAGRLQWRPAAES